LIAINLSNVTPNRFDRRRRSGGNPPTLEGAHVMTNFSELRVFLCMTSTSMNFSFVRLTIDNNVSERRLRRQESRR
jgi:hypothetical protein